LHKILKIEIHDFSSEKTTPLSVLRPKGALLHAFVFLFVGRAAAAYCRFFGLLAFAFLAFSD
jgi:hypothetical protein